MRLSEIQCKRIKPQSTVKKLFDGGGLYLEIMPNGSKLWRVKYRYAGREKRLSVGQYPLIALKEARERRDDAKKQLDRGIDPSIAKQEDKRKVILESTQTFESVAREWFTNVNNKRNPNNANDIQNRLTTHLFPKIGKLPIKSITPGMLLKALQSIETKGIYETAKRIKQYTSQIFRYAVVTGKVERDITVDIIGFLTPPKVKHHAALDIKEVPNLLLKIERNDTRLFFQTRQAMKLMLLTFVRTSELLKATWEEFDLDGKKWIIPGERMKMRLSHIVPLSNQVVEILHSLKDGCPDSKFILPSPNTPTKHLCENSILNGLYRFGYKGEATGHGFRALAMTTLKQDLGYRHEVVDRQLAHGHRNKVDAAYDRAQFLEERSKMMQEWADYVDCL